MGRYPGLEEPVYQNTEKEYMMISGTHFYFADTRSQSATALGHRALGTAALGSDLTKQSSSRFAQGAEAFPELRRRKVFDVTDRKPLGIVELHAMRKSFGIRNRADSFDLVPDNCSAGQQKLWHERVAHTLFAFLHEIVRLMNAQQRGKGYTHNVDKHVVTTGPKDRLTTPALDRQEQISMAILEARGQGAVVSWLGQNFARQEVWRAGLESNLPEEELWAVSCLGPFTIIRCPESCMIDLAFCSRAEELFPMLAKTNSAHVFALKNDHEALLTQNLNSCLDALQRCHHRLYLQSHICALTQCASSETGHLSGYERRENLILHPLLTVFNMCYFETACSDWEQNLLGNVAFVLFMAFLSKGFRLEIATSPRWDMLGYSASSQCLLIVLGEGNPWEWMIGMVRSFLSAGRMIQLVLDPEGKMRIYPQSVTSGTQQRKARALQEQNFCLVPQNGLCLQNYTKVV
ncbi:hypothetical protein EK904_014880 [Melospiza melodia maxima]|nr:hypothetical protein EK904_014880 [Melospiza melodia maxima]